MGLLVYQQEALRSFISEAAEMAMLQWQETGDPTLPCMPNWPMYFALEQRGALYLVVARDNDRAVGYVAGFAHPHVNSQPTLVATIPTYYVEERPAKAAITKSLLECAIAHFKNLGVARIYVETEYQQSAGRLLEMMDFEPVKIGYMLRQPVKESHYVLS